MHKVSSASIRLVLLGVYLLFSSHTLQYASEFPITQPGTLSFFLNYGTLVRRGM